MSKLTKEQVLILSGYTMVLMCEFSELHADIEKRLGRPVFTHELPRIEDEIKAAYKDDFIDLLP